MPLLARVLPLVVLALVIFSQLPTLAARRSGIAAAGNDDPPVKAASAPADVAVGPNPAGLPDHFWLGVANQPDKIDWMAGSGIPWEARYQYLAGGVNTGNGWAKWNSPDGQFATYYLNASKQHNYLPVFTYYMLLQSNPAQGGDEASKDFNNLNDNATMAAYYADFALLMQKCAEYGEPVLVHVEPDLWGYMEQRVARGSNSAATIPAAVASSGYPGVSRFPNTVQGFAWALQHLRSSVAPNVILAIHASAWGDGHDVGLDRDPNLDVGAIARRMSAFINSAGMSDNPGGARGWDLVFVDPSDRDAAYYAQWDGGAHWWDETNATYPNFNRYREWVTGLNRGTGRRIMLWQVPLGNTKMRSVNNTPGHWQDNRVQYFLGGTAPHLPAWIEAGVIGILFGRGEGQQTGYSDDRRDGVTNPPPINGNEGLATVADDDGGYLRAQAAAYYRRGALPLEQATATPVPATATPTRVPPSASPARTSTGQTPTPAGTPAACGTYLDVAADHWAYDYIRSLSCRGVVSGYADGTFRPGLDTTRAQLVKMVVTAMGWSTANPGSPAFSDVQPTDWFFPHVQVATQRALVGGYGDGSFRPYNNVTRGQLTKVIVGARGWGTISPARPTFEDVPADSPFFGHVEQAYARGIISGYGSTFRPNNPASRAQISKILYLALQAAKSD